MPDERIVVVVDALRAETLQPFGGLRRQAAKPLQDLADNERPGCLGSILQLERNAQTLFFKAEAIGAVGAALGDDVGIIIEQGAQVASSADHPGILVDARDKGGDSRLELVVRDRVDAGQIFIGCREVLHGDGKDRDAAAIHADFAVIGLRHFQDGLLDLLLDRGAHLPVVPNLSAHVALHEHQGRMLAGAVVVGPAHGNPLADAFFVGGNIAGVGRLHAEHVLRQTGFLPDALQRGNMEFFAGVGSGQNHALLVRQAVFPVQTAHDDRQSLDRFGGAAVIDHSVRIADRIKNTGMLVDDAEITHMGQIVRLTAVFLDQRLEIILRHIKRTSFIGFAKDYSPMN